MLDFVKDKVLTLAAIVFMLAVSFSLPVAALIVIWVIFWINGHVVPPGTP